MPATVRYKAPYPTETKPIESSASVGSDGLVTGNAVFVVDSPSNSYPIGSAVSPSIFSSLTNLGLQNLVVSSREFEKQNGLFYLRISVEGVINPPIVSVDIDASPRYCSKRKEDEDGNVITASFDYLAQTCKATTVYAEGVSFNFAPPTPSLLRIYNVIGDIAVLGPSGSPVRGLGTSGFANAALSASPVFLENESKQIKNGIVYHAKTLELIYQ